MWLSVVQRHCVLVFTINREILFPIDHYLIVKPRSMIFCYRFDGILDILKTSYFCRYNFGLCSYNGVPYLDKSRLKIDRKILYYYYFITVSIIVNSTLQKMNIYSHIANLFHNISRKHMRLFANRFAHIFIDSSRRQTPFSENACTDDKVTTNAPKSDQFLRSSTL